MSKKDKNQNTPDTPDETKKITADKLEEKKKKKEKKKKEKKSGDDSADKKSKLKIIIPIVAALVLIIAIVAILFARRSRTLEHTLYYDSKYPVVITEKKGNLVVSLKSKEYKDKNWEVRIEDEAVVKATLNGKQSRGKAKFILEPQMAGETDVDFVMFTEVLGSKYDLFTIHIPIYVSENNSGMKIQYLDGHYQQDGFDVVAEDTDYPIVLTGNSEEIGVQVKNYEDDSLATDTDATATDSSEEDIVETARPDLFGNLNFLNGVNDWEVTLDPGIASYIPSEHEKMYCVILQRSQTEGEDAASTTLSNGDVEVPADTGYDDRNIGPNDKNTSAGESMGIVVENEEEIEEASSDEATAEGQEQNAGTETNASASSDNARNAVLTLSSKSLGITKKFNVTFNGNGNIFFEPIVDEK